MVVPGKSLNIEGGQCSVFSLLQDIKSVLRVTLGDHHLEVETTQGDDQDQDQD